MKPFTYIAHPARVAFGAGASARAGDELDALGASRVLVLSTPNQRALADRIGASIGGRCVGVFDRAVMHVPVETVRDAAARARELAVDCTIAVGGGSTVGLAKALALDAGLPIVAIPTTYAGSEMTSIYGMTEGAQKRTGRDPVVLPKSVIYDPMLTMDLPQRVSAASGLNAIAHAAEALYADNRNPVMALMAKEGIAALARVLPRLVPVSAAATETERQRLLDARADALYGAWLCGSVLGSATMGLHHQLCHVLGGSFGLPHAETHAVVLPHALAYNAAAAPDAMREIATSLGADERTSAAQALHDLLRALDLPLGLEALGLRREDPERATAIAMQRRYPNPRPADAASVRQLLQDAFDGVRPGR